MDLEKRLSLIKNNTVEVVLEEELRALLASNKKPVAYCGYEPSGAVHLGHLVTINKLTDLQACGFDVKVLLADWHAFLNKKGDWDFIRKTAKLWKEAFLQLGLKKAEFVLGSSFQMKSGYFEDVLTLSSNATVARGTRSMQEVARNLDNALISQMIYPLMQIADIKHLGVDVAQAGIEQRKIHMLGREILESVGCKKPVLVHTPLINSLTGKGKMSSSDQLSFISVTDSADLIRQKMSKAFCPAGTVEANPVLDIARLIVFPRFGMVEVKRPAKFGGDKVFESYSELEHDFVQNSLHPMDLKNAIAECLVVYFSGAKRVLSKNG